MSKKITPLMLAQVLLLAASLASIGWFGAQTGAAQTATAVNPKSAAVVSATAEVLRETSELRGLSILRSVRSGAQSRDEIERVIIKNLNDTSTPEELRASEIAMKKLGLAPSNFRYREFIVKLLGEQVAGYYDPKTQEFYLADWIDLDGQKPVMAHELTHALQDQHFNLRRFEKWPKGDSDAELAAHALVEGDATLAMTHYVLRSPLRALAMMKSMSSGGVATEQLDRAPRALRESLLFPYEQGTTWATQVYKRGGWKLISESFSNLPQSTEQILHPEKYFAGEAPVKVELTNLAQVLGAGWRRTDYDVNGEWGCYLILNQFLVVEAEAKQAAAGWGGDRYALYENARTGANMIAQLSAWDTETDAREFFDAYAKRTARRYKGSLFDENRVDGVAAQMRREWRTQDGAVILERRGKHVAILEGVPAKADVSKLTKAIWRNII